MGAPPDRPRRNPKPCVAVAPGGGSAVSSHGDTVLITGMDGDDRPIAPRLSLLSCRDGGRRRRLAWGDVAVRIVFGEDHHLAREGIRRLLEAQPELEIVAVCGDLGSLMAAIDNHHPEVLLTDIRMPPTGTDEGIKAAEHLKEVDPDAGVVLLSQYADPELAVAFFAAGSRGRGYLLKERVWDVEQLVTAIQEVSRGGSVIDPDVVDVLVTALSRSAASPLSDLNPREAEILAHMAQGKSNAAIAASVFLSDRAVEKYINSIFSKLGVSQESDLNRRVKAVLVFLAAQPT